jgi:predicted phosphoribosyltransferase
MVAAPVAAGLRAELDAVAVCPIAGPRRSGHSIGAVTASGPPVFVRRSLDGSGLSAAAVDSAVAVARQQARKRELALRGYVPPSMIAGRTVIVVDDGLGIGVNALAVVRHVLRRRPARLLFAAPVCAMAYARTLAALADEVISVAAPPGAVMAGSFYAQLAPVDDGDVRPLLLAGPKKLQSKKVSKYAQSTKAQSRKMSNAVPPRPNTLNSVPASEHGGNRAVNGA